MSTVSTGEMSTGGRSQSRSDHFSDLKRMAMAERNALYRRLKTLPLWMAGCGRIATADKSVQGATILSPLGNRQAGTARPRGGRNFPVAIGDFGAGLSGQRHRISSSWDRAKPATMPTADFFFVFRQGVLTCRPPDASLPRPAPFPLPASSCGHRSLPSLAFPSCLGSCRSGMARLDAVVGQSLTIAACPQQQSRHFSLIARIGFNANTWSGGQFGFIAEKQLHWLIALGAEAWSPTAEAHSLTEAHGATSCAPGPRIGPSRGFGPSPHQGIGGMAPAERNEAEKQKTPANKRQRCNSTLQPLILDVSHFKERKHLPIIRLKPAA